MIKPKDYTGATVSIYTDQRKDRLSAEGTYPISLRIVFRGKNTNYSTGLRCQGKEELEAILFNKSVKADKYARTRKALKEKYEKAFDICAQLGDDFTNERFNALYNADRSTGSSVYELWQEIIDERMKSGQHSTAVGYRCAMDSFRGKEGRKGFAPYVTWRQITPQFLKEYEQWMEEQGKSRVSTGVYLRSLRVVINKALTRKLIKESPFGDPNKGKYSIPGPGAKKNIAIPKDQIRAIAEYPLIGKAAFYRDMFVLQFLMNGCYPSEIAYLRWSDISHNEIRFKRQKTKRTAKNQTEIVVKMGNDIQKIIDRHGVPGSPYVFPVIRGGQSAEEQYNSLKGHFIKGINKTVAKVAKELGIDHISAKVARHSAASQMAKDGAPLPDISVSLGHENQSQTYRYLMSMNRDLPTLISEALKLGL